MVVFFGVVCFVCVVFWLLVLLLVSVFSVFVLRERDQDIGLCTGPLPASCGRYSFGPCVN